MRAAHAIDPCDVDELASRRGARSAAEVSPQRPGRGALALAPPAMAPRRARSLAIRPVLRPAGAQRHPSGATLLLLLPLARVLGAAGSRSAWRGHAGGAADDTQRGQSRGEGGPAAHWVLLAELPDLFRASRKAWEACL